MRESPETAEMKCSVPPQHHTASTWISDSAREGALPISRQRMQRQRFPDLPQPVLGQLPEIGVLRAGHDQFCRDVALDPLEPGVLGDEGLAVRDEIDQVVLGIGRILPLLPDAPRSRNRG